MITTVPPAVQTEGFRQRLFPQRRRLRSIRRDLAGLRNRIIDTATKTLEVAVPAVIRQPNRGTHFLYRQQRQIRGLRGHADDGRQHGSEPPANNETSDGGRER